MSDPRHAPDQVGASTFAAERLAVAIRLQLLLWAADTAEPGSRERARSAVQELAPRLGRAIAELEQLAPASASKGYERAAFLAEAAERVSAEARAARPLPSPLRSAGVFANALAEHLAAGMRPDADRAARVAALASAFAAWPPMTRDLSKALAVNAPTC